MAHHETVIAAGVGYRADCTAQDIVAAVIACVGAHGYAPDRIGALCTVDFKATDAELESAARELGTPLLSFSRLALERHAGHTLTSSQPVQDRFGLPSIAETAALAGALELLGGTGSVRLLGARHVVGAVACALAAAGEPPA